MRYLKFISLAFLFISLCSFYEPKTFSPWDFIGDKIAAYGKDRDVLHVSGNDAFRQVKIKVTDAPLHVIDMDIYFEDDSKMNVPLKNKFKQGQESRVIDLPGGLRRIKKIEFLYETIGVKKGRARIAVWGKR